MKKTEKPWGSTFLRSSMFWRSWLFKEHVKPVSRRKQHWNCWGQPTVLVFHLEGIAGQLQCASAILRQQPCKLNPCPIVWYVLVLTKGQGKGKWALPKNIAMAVEDYLAKEGCLEHPFSKQILRNYQPCVSTPRTLEQHKDCAHAQNFILQLWRNIPLTSINNNDLDRVRLLNTCCITQKVRCWGGNNQKDIAKEQGHGRKTYKVFSLNPFY